ncbi:MAG: methionyl-tRNA formyltransferase [Candidatus Atribacteria bacterium]|nr:methionyl-tRNA formyltransferase [Candidatus Atribacteria bacterium]
MRIVFIGTSSFGIPILSKLMDLKKDVVAVITQPDRPCGRGKKIQASPIKALALQYGLYVFQPEDINSEDAIREISRLQPDLIVLVAYGQILSGTVLKLPTHGCLNIHPSLLPKYKGPAPINWALIKGEEETGITFLFMDEKIDAGDIILQKRIKILAGENFEQLSSRLAEESAKLLEGVLFTVEKEECTLCPQPQEEYFYARKIDKDDCRIDWKQDSRKICNLIRGLTLSPCAYTEYDGRRVKIVEAHLLDQKEIRDNSWSYQPGSIIELSKNGIMVLAGDGRVVVIKKVIPSGSSEMDASGFINGYHVEVGDRFE